MFRPFTASLRNACRRGREVLHGRDVTRVGRGHGLPSVVDHLLPQRRPGLLEAYDDERHGCALAGERTQLGVAVDRVQAPHGDGDAVGEVEVQLGHGGRHRVCIQRDDDVRTSVRVPGELARHWPGRGRSAWPAPGRQQRLPGRGAGARRERVRGGDDRAPDRARARRRRGPRRFDSRRVRPAGIGGRHRPGCTPGTRCRNGSRQREQSRARRKRRAVDVRTLQIACAPPRVVDPSGRAGPATLRAVDDAGMNRTLLPVGGYHWRVLRIPADQPPASEAIEAIHAGDVDTLGRLLADEPELATARIVRARGHTLTLLHVACDWPGHFPNGAETVGRCSRGADVGARYEGPHNQTPLHWAASSDDVEVARRTARGGCGHRGARRFDNVGGPLTTRSASGNGSGAPPPRARRARQALARRRAGPDRHDRATLRRGTATDRPTRSPRPSGRRATATSGGSRVSGRRGADINWIGYDDLTPLDNARRSGADNLAEWVEARGGKPAEVVRRR